MPDVQVHATFEQNDDESEGSEDRANLAEVGWIDDVGSGAKCDPGKHEYQNVRNLGTPEEVSQEMAEKDQQSDA